MSASVTPEDELHLESQLKEYGPPYIAHYSAWRALEIKEVPPTWEELIEESLLEACCMGMFKLIAPGMASMINTNVALLTMNVVLASRKNKVTVEQFETALNLAKFEHWRKIPHPADMPEPPGWREWMEGKHG